MERIENKISHVVKDAMQVLYNQDIQDDPIQIQKTRAEFEGDLTIVVFPFIKFTKEKPETTAHNLGNYLSEHIDVIERFNVIKGFLNVVISHAYWIEFLKEIHNDPDYGIASENSEAQRIVIEYSSPNTNKPLHLGHIRNNLLGYALSNIYKANGHKVNKVNLVNDRGIHICKSMLAWQKWGKEEDSPENSGRKGDHVVGDFYVRFDTEYKSQVQELINKGYDKDEAEKQAPLLLEAQEMLQKWEAGDPELHDLWNTMNQWVCDGFDETYEELGVDFDKIYYESETYKLGKQIVLEGLENGVFYKHTDGSVWADLTSEGLDHKILLRTDGTSVYITQDIGTAVERYSDFSFDEMLYIVGNEQDYHFKVLGLLLKQLGYEWYNRLTHLSYGMVELPHGKMKSREGTVVDADDLIGEMIETARQISEDSGKLANYSDTEKEQIYKTIGLGALKYFILKVDPKKKMLFDPEESIDFNGNTGPFIQYTYARIQSVFDKAKNNDISYPTSLHNNISINEKEKALLKLLHQYPEILTEAGKNENPADVANYVYELVKQFNQFYQEHSIMKAESQEIMDLRLMLANAIAHVVESGMGLLGITVPERM